MTYLEARAQKDEPTIGEIFAAFEAYYAEPAKVPAQVPAWVLRAAGVVVCALFAGALVMPA